MTNPYQTPRAVIESQRIHIALWRRIVGSVLMLASSLPILYGAIIVFTILLTGAADSPGLILILGGLILCFGLSLAAFGFGMWTGRTRLTANGIAAVFLSVLTYLATAMVLF